MKKLVYQKDIVVQLGVPDLSERNSEFTFALGAKKENEARRKILEYVHFSYVCDNTGSIPHMANQQVGASNLCDIIILGF